VLQFACKLGAKKIMKSRILTVIMILSFTLLPFAVTAQSDDSSSTDQTSTSDSKTDEQKQLLKDKLKSRLDERRADFATKLDALREQKLKNSCKRVQNKLGAITNRANAVYDNRVSLYDRLSEKLDSLLTRLDNNDQTDTTDLTAIIEELNSMVEAFLTDFDVYILSLQDAVDVVGCEDDPTSFHEFLETAKELRSSLKDQSKAISDYISKELRPALVDLKAQLSANSDTNNDSQ
jgi:inorganic triphosphatase YgiF